MSLWRKHEVKSKSYANQVALHIRDVSLLLSMGDSPMVARFPNYVKNGSATYTFTVNKDLLKLTTKGKGFTKPVKLQRVR